MRPEFVSRYEKRKPLRDKMQFLETIYDKYSDIAANDSSLTLKDIVDKIKEEATSQNLILSSSDIKYIKDRFKEEYPERYEQTIKGVPMGRFADPEKDVGGMCVFLCSDLASYVTGETITLQGGSGLRP